MCCESRTHSRGGVSPGAEQKAAQREAATHTAPTASRTKRRARVGDPPPAYMCRLS